MKSILIFFLFLTQLVYAQNRSDSYFKNGNRITFIGNSITHGTQNTERFHNYILLYYATRFPTEKIAVYNAGIWGDNVNGMGRRMEDDFGARQAHISLVMAGMNDVNRGLYDPARQGEAGIETQKQRALSDYKGYYKTLIQKLLLANSKVILQKPSIYDQTSTIGSANMVGVNDALQQCNVIIDDLAQEFNLETVDYWTILNNLNEQVQQGNPQATLISNDRIHPGADGNFIMAYQFLKTSNAPQYVSNTEIENGVLSKNEFCTITDLTTTSNSVSFKYKSESLPFPVTSEVDRALSLTYFQSELNAERLKVAGLAPGKYGLEIDGNFIAGFTADEIGEGINLALLKNTPQYLQALEVKVKTDAHRDLQVKLRDIKLIEINYLAKSLWTDFSAATAYINDLKNRNVQPYVSQKNRFDAYLINKPNEASLESELANLTDEIYTVNIPVEHTIQIRPNTQTHSWDFNGSITNNQTDGWIIVNYSDPNIVDGVLTLKAAQTYCHIKYNIPAGTIDPSISKKAIIKIKNNTSDTKARLYWWGTNAVAAYIEFAISANDNLYKEYTIDLENDPRWSGNISMIRFDIPSPVFPGSIGETVNIDYIKLAESNLILPISLKTFTATNRNNKILLSWSTAHEINNSHFDILRSEDGTVFHKLGSVMGRNKLSETSLYFFNDENPYVGTNYYRLDQIDFDGAISSFNIIAVKKGVEEASSFNVLSYHQGNLNLSISASSLKNKTLIITDILGRKWIERSFNLQKGNNSIEIPILLPPGLYIAALKTETEVKSIKFIIE